MPSFDKSGVTVFPLSVTAVHDSSRVGMLQADLQKLGKVLLDAVDDGAPRTERLAR